MIIEFNQTYAKNLSDLLVTYFPEVNSDIPEEIIRGKLMELILKQHQQKLLEILLIFEQEACIGFSIFQIDKLESDWCKRPGWGFIREFYIQREYRHRGFGSELAWQTEQRLRELGAKNLYLTSDSGISFWLRCGWKKTTEICSNGLVILEK